MAKVPVELSPVARAGRRRRLMLALVPVLAPVLALANAPQMAARAAAILPNTTSPNVQMVSPRPVRAKLDAYPRIAHPADAAQRRINAALDRLDAKVRVAVAACTTESNRPADWERSVDTTMNGPEFISYAIANDYDCGGLHPNTSYTAIVYDVQTGAPVDWTRLLPAKLTGTVGLVEGADGVRMVTLSAPRLFALYRAGYKIGVAEDDVETECRAAVAAMGDSGGPVPLVVWLAAAKGGVALQFDFNHAQQACSKSVVIPIATLRREGASLRLLTALMAAHNRARGGPIATKVRRMSGRSDIDGKNHA